FGLVDIRVVALDLTVDGTVNGTAFTQVGSSCAQSRATLRADNYDAPVLETSAGSTFGPLGCPDGLPYAPRLAATIARERGSRATAVITRLTQAPGEAATARVQVTLPSGLAPRLPDVIRRVCSSLDPASCPAVSKVGS